MPTIAQLQKLDKSNLGNDDLSIPVSTNGITARLSPEDMAEMLWDKMYVHAQKVIIPCPYCSSMNAITNPSCVQCGGPMGAK